MRILFMTPRFPYPPLRGDQVRAYHQLRLLGARHAITLLAVARGALAPAARAHVEGLCERVVVVPLTAGRAAAGLARALAGDGRPFQTLLYLTAAWRKVHELVRNGGFDLVHVQLVRMAGCLPADAGLPVVVDLIDALSESFARRQAVDRRWLRPLLAFEARRLARYERELLEGPARCLVVSEAERVALGDRNGRLVVNPNGVDLAAFPFTPGRGVPGRILFAGNLGYMPNADAAVWFVEEILPRVRAEVPEAELVIAGPRAPRAVRRLAYVPDVTLAGVVPDMHAAIAGARVAVAPLRAGAGIQNKVLEAMAAGTPVVATPRAVGGIAARAGEHCLVAEDAAGLASAVSAALRDPDLGGRLAAAARDLVAARYSWERSVAGLEALYRTTLESAGG